MNKHFKAICVCILLSFPMLLINELYAQTSTFKYLQDERTGSLIKVLAVENKVTDKDGIRQPEFRYQLELNKHIISLQKGEVYIGDAKNVFYTNASTLHADGSTELFLNSYTINSGSITKNNSLKLEDVGYEYFLSRDNANILVSDEFEGLGYEVTLYSPNLQKMLSYRPFADIGFRSSIKDVKGENAAFVFFPTDRQLQPKLVLIDTRSGKLKFEKSLSADETDITNLTLIGDYMVTSQHQNPSKQELLCYDSKGNLLWRKQQSVYALEAFKEGSKWLAFVMDKDDYWFINLENGDVNNKRSLKEIIPPGQLDRNLSIDIISNSNASSINLLVSKKNVDQTAKYQHEIFTIRDSKAAFLKRKTIQSNDEFLSFINLNSKTLVNNSANQIIYDYEN